MEKVSKYAGAKCILDCLYKRGVINRPTYEAAVKDLENRYRLSAEYRDLTR